MDGLQSVDAARSVASVLDRDSRVHSGLDTGIGSPESSIDDLSLFDLQKTA